jgi:hypothetical protein
MAKGIRIRLTCPCGHQGSVLVRRIEPTYEDYVLEGLQGKQGTRSETSLDNAQVLSLLQPICPSCKGSLKVSDITSIASLVG